MLGKELHHTVCKSNVPLDQKSQTYNFSVSIPIFVLIKGPIDNSSQSFFHLSNFLTNAGYCIMIQFYVQTSSDKTVEYVQCILYVSESTLNPC